MSAIDLINPKDVTFKIKFDTPHSVTYGVVGGHFWTTSGVVLINETLAGDLILHKNDGTFTKISKGWLSYDVQQV